MQRTVIVRAAACAALALAGIARAEDVSRAADTRLTTTDLSLDATSARPLYLQDAAPSTESRSLSGTLLDRFGLTKTFESAHLNVGGLVEGSYTYSASSPPGNFITGRVFDVEQEDPTLNQLALFAERQVNVAESTKAGKFDIGARVEFRWGGDSRFIHSVGLFDHYGFGDGPDNQWDLTQAYVDFAIPVGNGLLIRVGKQVTPIGLEVISPDGNALYSHSFLFGYAIPFTHTGVFGTYVINDSMTVNAAVTRGWDTSTEDNNDTVDFLGWVNYTFSKETSAQIAFISGPDQPGDNDNYRSLVDLVVKTNVGDNLSLAFNGDYAYERNSGTAVSGSDAQWWGVAGYASYKVNPSVVVNGRVEYFNDDDGARIAGGVGGAGLFEATLGLAITPFPSSPLGQGLVIRPEVRYDYATKDFFDGGTDRYQFSAAIDAYYKF